MQPIQHTTNQAAIAALFRVVNRYVGNLAPMTGVFPDYAAPVICNTETGTELTMLRWGMPPPPRIPGLGTRGLLCWSQTDLAEAVGRSLPTIKRLENEVGAKVSDDVRLSVQTALRRPGSSLFLRMAGERVSGSRSVGNGRSEC